MSKSKKIFIVLDSLLPNMEDWMDNSMYQHWMDYSYFLDDLADAVYKDEDIIPIINSGLASYSGGAKYHAAYDVALTLENVFPTTFGGLFKYE